MDGSNWPIVLIEGVLVLGGALAFGWWQLRSLERDRRETQRRREQASASDAPTRADERADAGPASAGDRPD